MTTHQTEWAARMLASIPDVVLSGRRRYMLARWCADRQFKPTLFDLENERTRRKEAP